MSITLESVDALTRQLVQHVAELEGRVAALTSYIAHTGSYARDEDVRTAQGVAQEMSPAPIFLGGANPALYASQHTQVLHDLATRVALGRKSGLV